MPEALQGEKLRALDACIEQLLAGRDWRRALPNDQTRAEIVALMEVAEWLLESAGRTPRVPARVRQRVWTRVWRALHPPNARVRRERHSGAAGWLPRGRSRALLHGGGYGASVFRGGWIPPGMAPA